MADHVDAVLAYGYDLGGPGHRWAVHERDGEGGLGVPWFGGGERGSFPVRVGMELIGKLRTPVPATPPVSRSHYESEATALRNFGVAVVVYNTQAAPCYLLAAAVLRVGRPEVAADTGIVSCADPAQLTEWRMRLSAALEALGLTPFQQRASWLLCSYLVADGEKEDCEKH